MTFPVIRGGRHGQAGLYSLADLPQRESIEKSAIGTGWWELDQIWKLYPGQFNVITGIAGSGKSTFLLNVICNIARDHGAKSFLFVPENEGHVRDKLRLIWGERDGFDHFCREQCFVQSATPDGYQTEPQTIHWVLDQAEIAVDKDGVDFLLIDPWNEIERAKPKDMLLGDYIGVCLMYLKQFCRSRNATVMLVAHPTKAGVVEGKTPTLADIEGSMNWYNKCDNGLIVVRDQAKPTSQVISAKVREIGAGKRGMCNFFVDEKTGIFTPQYGAVS